MIEINLNKLERGTREGMVTVRRGGTVFQRKQKLGRKESESASESDYESNKKEFERLKAAPAPRSETTDQMNERLDALHAARNKMHESDPKWVAEQKAYNEQYERQKNEPEPKKKYITKENIKKGMIINREDETKRFKVVKVARVNAYVLPHPSLPGIDKEQKIRITALDRYVES